MNLSMSITSPGSMSPPLSSSPTTSPSFGNLPSTFSSASSNSGSGSGSATPMMSGNQAPSSLDGGETSSGDFVWQMIQHAACRDPPDLDGIASLLEKGKLARMDGSWRNEKGCTLLHLMSMKGSTRHLSMVLASSDLQAVDLKGRTALHLASQRGHLECIKILIAAGLDVNVEDSYRMSPLHYAAHEGHKKAIELLIEKGAAVDYLDMNRATPLFKAACRGHLPCVKLLIERGAMINREDKYGNNAMLAAAMQNQFEVGGFLRKRGLSGSSHNKDGDTLLWAATLHGNLSFINLLLSLSSSNLPSNSSSTPYNVSSYSPSPTTSALASSTTPPPSPSTVDLLNQTMGPHQFTILHRAIEHVEDRHCNKILKKLIKKGLRVDAQIDDGKTGIFFAAFYHKIETLRMLLHRGGDPFATDCAGNCALHFASSREAVETILESVPKNQWSTLVNLKNSQENTPLHSASVFFGQEVMSELKARGAEENLRNKNGNTPSQAAWAGVKKICIPFGPRDEAYTSCGGIYIAKVN
eukprot:TRINITY_DN7376_c0_g1_i1.p1 TRINITY_DN7376_c0_g1~~TRINITY_DN7376_c0_g1_i1.p1  ORF type:complete len:526 (-),score=118.10 TRINITY_DN7376_c0_g1_i1:205-1782(-)